MGEEHAYFRKFISRKKLRALSEKNAKIWHSFIERLSKNAIHLPGERMQLKVVNEQKVKLFPDLSQTSRFFGKAFGTFKAASFIVSRRTN